MTELAKSIRPYGGRQTSAKGSEESPFAMDVQGSIAGNLHTPVSESGNSQQLGATFYNCPNTRDCYGLGFQLHFTDNDGSEYYSSTSHFGGSLSISKTGQGGHFPTNGKERFVFGSDSRLYIGIGQTGDAGTFDIGNDLSYGGTLKLADRFGLGVAPYFGTLNTLPSDSLQTENIPVLSLQMGVRFKLAYTDLSLTPAPKGITNYDIAHLWVSAAHRLASGYATAKALAGPSAQAGEYTAEMFGEDAGSGSSQKLEGLPSLTVINTAIGISGTSDRFSTALKANKSQRGWILGAEASSALGAYLLSFNDDSNTMLTQGFAGTLELVDIGIGYGTDPKSFHLYRTLANGLAFMLGLGFSDSKAGGALLVASQQALMAGMFSPDPLETGLVSGGSHFLAYEHDFGNDSNLIGYQNIRHLTSSYLYTSTGVFLQTSPVVNDGFQEGLDTATSRDAGTQSGRAKLTAGLGFEAQTAQVVWGIGAHSALLLQESGAPQPGLGADQRMLFSFGEKTRFEFGLQVSEELFGDSLQFSIMPLAGVRL